MDRTVNVKNTDKLQPEFEIYQSLVENSPDLFYRTNTEGLITYISPSVFKLSGYTIQEAIGMNMAQEVYLFPEERQDFLEQLSKNGQVYDFEAQLKRKDGSIWWASSNARFFKDEKGRPLGVEGMTRDISRLKAADQALQESEERFRMAFHTSPDSINLNRVSDGMYIDINQGFTDLTGYTRQDVMGKTSLEIKIWYDIEDRNRLVAGLMKTGHVKNLEARFVKKNGDINIGLMSARILRIRDEEVILSITRDISDLKRAQAVMIQSEKMLSIGGLAAGMAHEINNPLAGMIQSAEMMDRRLSDTALPANISAANEMGLEMDAVKGYMEKRNILKMCYAIKETGSRIARLVENMLSFARKSEGRSPSCSISEILDKTIDLAGTDFDLKRKYDFKKIAIKREYEKDLPFIPCEETKLQQVFLNILHNGTQAMQDASTPNPGFRLKIRVDRQAEMICIEIEDNGPGMEKEIKKRIFDPFFTTKPAGVGTGLGLSVSYFIITEDHGGTLEVVSEPGKGASFIVRLPLG